MIGHAGASPAGRGRAALAARADRTAMWRGIGADEPSPVRCLKAQSGRSRPAASKELRQGLLLLSIHDVSPRFEAQIDCLREQVEHRVPMDRLALFVVPDHWGTARIAPGTPFARKLRGWVEEGAEILLHGWQHIDDQRQVTAWDRWKARRMTAGEGEFLGLSREDARKRLRDGRSLLEDVTGRPVNGFVAPAWLYGPGARAALRDEGFDLAEDHLRVWDPTSGRRLCKGPVLTWASRTQARALSSLAAAAVLPAILRHFPVARVGLHPGDVTRPDLRRSIDRALGRLIRTHAAGRYAALRQSASTCAS